MCEAGPSKGPHEAWAQWEQIELQVYCSAKEESQESCWQNKFSVPSVLPLPQLEHFQ